MKQLLIILSLFCPFLIKAQNLDTLKVNDGKFINLQFNSAVSITQSSQPTFFFIEAKSNVLFIQSLDKNVIESNLFVQTNDGRTYNFIVKYIPVLTKIVYNYKNNVNYNANSESYNADTDIQNYSITDINPLINKTGYINSRNRSSKGKVDLYFKGVYNNANKLYVLLFIENKSSLNYEVADLKLFIRPAKAMKNIATQDEELNCKFYDFNKIILSRSSIYITIELEKIALIDKVLSIDLLEKNGDRNINFNINHNLLTESKSIN